MGDGLGLSVILPMADAEKLLRGIFVVREISAMCPVEPVAPERTGEQLDTIETSAQYDRFFEDFSRLGIRTAFRAEQNPAQRELELDF